MHVTLASSYESVPLPVFLPGGEHGNDARQHGDELDMETWV